jgi:cytochrome oxidase Cu insertion factor (SCO1/SenC/PrrC family)
MNQEPSFFQLYVDPHPYRDTKAHLIKYGKNVAAVAMKVCKSKGYKLSDLCNKYEVKDHEVIQFIIESTEYDTVQASSNRSVWSDVAIP